MTRMTESRRSRLNHQIKTQKSGTSRINNDTTAFRKRSRGKTPAINGMIYET
jgi:hypothetical protein